MTRKTNAWGRPITEATPTPVQNPWLTRLGKAPTPAAKPTGNPWIDRMKLQTPPPEEPTTTARFGTETTPAGRTRNPCDREKVEQTTKPISEQKPAPAATTQAKIVQESDPLAPWSAAQLQLVAPGTKINVVRKGAGGKWEPAYGFRSAS